MTSSASCLSFNPPPPTAIYTLSLHDALPISVSELADQPAHRGPRGGPGARRVRLGEGADQVRPAEWAGKGDRKSTRLNSSHTVISYAVFCLKKKIPQVIVDAEHLRVDYAASQ